MKRPSFLGRFSHGSRTHIRLAGTSHSGAVTTLRLATLTTFAAPPQLNLDERILAKTKINNYLNAKQASKVGGHDLEILDNTGINFILSTMSGRLVSARLARLARPTPSHASRQIHHRAATTAGGLIRTDAAARTARRRIWPMGYNYLHNAVAVRNASFVRILPKLALKFARIPAMFGGAMIAGLAYLQYQATRMYLDTTLA